MSKIAFLVTSDKHERLQFMAMVSSIHATTGGEVLIFISMNAIKVFKKGLSKEERIIGEGEFSNLMKEKNVPFYMDLLKQIKAFGDVKIYACSMAMDILHWELNDLEEGIVDDILGLTAFLDMCEDAKFMFV